jgi:selenoprotein W-related protein
MAQELLSTFTDDLAEVSLIPSHGGKYQIWIDEQLIWDRKDDGGFPDAKLIKQRVRDYAWPDKELGHIDK